jgi:ribonuclease R
VRLDALGRDLYELDESGLAVIGVRNGERIAIGDTMVVQIEDVAVLRRSILGRRVIAAADEMDGEGSDGMFRAAPDDGERPRRAKKRTESTAAAPARKATKKTVRSTKKKLDKKRGRR